MPSIVGWGDGPSDCLTQHRPVRRRRKKNRRHPDDPHGARTVRGRVSPGEPPVGQPRRQHRGEDRAQEQPVPHLDFELGAQRKSFHRYHCDREHEHVGHAPPPQGLEPTNRWESPAPGPSDHRKERPQFGDGEHHREHQQHDRDRAVLEVPPRPRTAGRSPPVPSTSGGRTRQVRPVRSPPRGAGPRRTAGR